MSEEKVQKEREVKGDGKLEKQVANIAYTVRKMKDWLEEKMGADIDGDGRVGSGPYKKAFIFMLIAGMASFCMAEDRTAIAYWSSKAKITSDGFVGDAVISSMTIGNATVSGTLGVTGILTASSNLVVSRTLTASSNATVGGTLGVTGIATLTAAPVMSALTASKPVFTDDSKALTSSGTLGVDQGGSGAATFTDHGVLLGSAATAFSVTAVGTDGQVFLGASGADPTWGTMGGDASIAANGTVTVSKGLAMTNGASLQNIPTAGLTLGGANIKSMLDCADYSAVRTALTLRPGTDIQAWDAQLDTWSGVTPSTDGQALVALANYATMRTNIVGAGTVTASMLDPTIVTNVLASGMVLPAVDGAAVTNLAGGNIASGNIAAARITTALGTSGGSIGGNIPLAALTNALSVTLYSGTYTNASTLITNVITVLNGVVVSVTTTGP